MSEVTTVIDELIAVMKEYGWTQDDTGAVHHCDLELHFPNWMQAIKACIEVASEG